MAEDVIELNENTFEAPVGSGVALVDFWAPWCGPCLIQGPIVQELAGEAPDAAIAKLNVDECQSLAVRFNVMSIPTIIIFKDGQEVERFIGVQDKNTLQHALEKAMGSELH